MAAIILNGNTYDTTAGLYPPSEVAEKLNKIGTVIVSESGARTLVYRGQKREWALTWNSVPGSTRAAVIALAALTTTFTYTDEHGQSYTVQTEPDDHDSNTAFADHNGTQYYDCSLTIREA